MDDDLYIALRSAIDSKRVDILKVILEDAKAKGVISNYINAQRKGKTLLHYATEKENVDAVRTLLAFNADPSVLSEDDRLSCYQTALHNMKLADVYHSYFLQLVTNDKLEQVKQCVDAGLDCNQEYPVDGAFILHWACQYSDYDTIAFLLRNGAKCDVIDSDGLTALHVAVRSSNESAIRAVMEHSENVDVTVKAPFGDYRGFSAVELCQKICPQFEHYFKVSDTPVEKPDEEHALSPDGQTSSTSDDGELMTAPSLDPKGELALIATQSKEASVVSSESIQFNSSGDSLGKLKTLIFKQRKHSDSTSEDLLLCPLPKLVNHLAEDEFSNVSFSQSTHFLVTLSNFKNWQNALDLVTMMLNPLSRLGFKFSISLISTHLDTPLQSHQYPLDISCLETEGTSSKPSKYILNVGKRKCFIKCYSLDGARSALATFVQLLAEKEPLSSGKVVFDNSTFETRSIMFDLTMWLSWKTGILYEVILLSSLLKYNQLVISLNTSAITSFGNSLESLCQKVVEVVILAERFCLQVVPYFDLSSLNLDVNHEFANELMFFKRMLSCFNSKKTVFFGPNFTNYLAQNPKLMDYSFYSIGIGSTPRTLSFFVNSVSAVGILSGYLPEAVVCCSKPEVLKEAMDIGMRVMLRSERRKTQRSLITIADMPKMFSLVHDSSFSEGCLTVCCLASESVPLFVTCLPQLIVNSEFSWNASCLISCRKSSHFVLNVADKLLFKQAPGFANALNVLSNVENVLVRSRDSLGNEGDVAERGQSSPILRWLEDPGSLNVDRTDPHSISQAEKDLRSIFSFIDTHLHSNQESSSSNQDQVSPRPFNQKLAYQTQAFLFQLRACANIALFTVKLLKSLYFAGKNPAASTPNGFPGKSTATPNGALPSADKRKSTELNSVNLGVASLSLQVKSDLANRLIVAINDLKLIAKQELDESALKVFNQDAFLNILDQFVQGPRPTAMF